MISLYVRRETGQKSKTLRNKYRSLVNENSERGTAERIENTYLDGFVQKFSSITLTREENELLNKGLKYCLPWAKPPVDELLVDIMASVNNLPEDVQH